jgi:hypothetical protein
MRLIRIAGVCVLAAIVIVSASREPTPNPLTPRAYLDRALALIQANALDAPALDWVAVTRRQLPRIGERAASRSSTRAVKSRPSASIPTRINSRV